MILKIGESPGAPFCRPHAANFCAVRASSIFGCMVHQGCPRNQPPIGCRIVHRRGPSAQTTYRMPHRPPALPPAHQTNHGMRHRPPVLPPAHQTNHRMPHPSTSAVQAHQPANGMPHRPPASPKQIQINSPRRHPVHSHRGGIGDSTLHSRNTLAFACRTRSANSVSLHARTVCSSLSQFHPACSCIPALGSERSFS
jgi:hypothetical protein